MNTEHQTESAGRNYGESQKVRCISNGNGSIRVRRSKALAFGRAVHKAILEPCDFFSEFAIAPEVNRRTLAGRKEWDEFASCNSGKEIITMEDYGMVAEMVKAVQDHEVAAALLCGAVEQSFFWTDDQTGEACKCRTDCLSEWNGEKYIVDYKTTDSCEDGHFERSCRKYGYKFQAGMYTEGVFQNTFDQYRFAFVAQEKKPPYAVRVYICTPEFVQQGIRQVPGADRNLSSV